MLLKKCEIYLIFEDNIAENSNLHKLFTSKGKQYTAFRLTMPDLFHILYLPIYMS